MPAAQCQRSQFAEGLSPDPDSGQLVSVQKHVSSFASSIQSIDDGVVFLSKDIGHDGGYAPSHRCMATVPSQVAERIAGIARTAKAAGENDRAVREHLCRWNTYGVLFNIILEEEHQLRSSPGLTRIVSTNEILLGNISKMPRIFKHWNPMITSVSLESTGTTVTFSDCSNNPLICVWVSHDGDYTDGPARSSPDTPRTIAKPQIMVAIKMVRSLYSNSPPCTDSKVGRQLAAPFGGMSLSSPMMSRNHVINDGIEFFPTPGLDYVPTMHPEVCVIVPFMLAKRLAKVAVDAKADKVHTTEEDKIRSAHGIADWIPTPDVFEKHPETMPRVVKTWAPKNTIVDPTPDGTAVIFKDSKQNGLIRFWISSEEGSDDEESTPCITVERSNRQKKTEFQLPVNVSPSAYTAMATTRSQLWPTDSRSYDTLRMDQIPGGLLIGAPWKAQLKATIPSDLAQHLKNVATQAASSAHPREKTPAERVRDAVRDKMVKWARTAAIPVLVNLTDPQETALRERSNAPKNVFTTPLFIKYPSLLPPVWVDWDPAATTVKRDAHWGQIIVVFKNKNGKDLIGVWFKG